MWAAVEKEKHNILSHNTWDPELIEEWAEKTGRPTRPNHAP